MDDEELTEEEIEDLREAVEAEAYAAMVAAAEEHALSLAQLSASHALPVGGVAGDNEPY